jgi:hypothetical protein
MNARLLALVLPLLALAACGTPTPYAPANGGYGYGAQRVEDGRFRVSFSGNALTSRQTVENYLLYRAAEVTLAEGGDHFVIVRRNTEPDTTWLVSPGGGPWYPGYWGPRHWHPGYGYGYSAWDDTTARAVTRYGADAEIVVRRGPKPPGDPLAFDAHSVIRNLGPTIRRLLPPAG